MVDGVVDAEVVTAWRLVRPASADPEDAFSGDLGQGGLPRQDRPFRLVVPVLAVPKAIETI